MAQTVDLLIDGGILLNVGICVSDIRLWLIVIVIGDEVFYRIIREKLPEFRAKLGSQGLIVGQHQRGLIHLLDDRSHGEGLAGTGDTQKHLLPQAVFNAKGQLRDGLGLIAGGTKFRYQLKFIHTDLPSVKSAHGTGPDGRLRTAP